MKKYLLVIIFFVLLCNFGCNQRKERKLAYAYSMNDPRLNDSTITRSGLRNRIVLNGDIKAYNDLSMWYYDDDYPQEILFYSLLMANKYNYDQAYYDVYSTIISIYIVDYSIDSSIDDVSADLAMSYLFKAAEKGHQQAKRKVEKVISSGVKDSKEQVKIAYHAF